MFTEYWFELQEDLQSFVGDFIGSLDDEDYPVQYCENSESELDFE